MEEGGERGGKGEEKGWGVGVDKSCEKVCKALGEPVS